MFIQFGKEGAQGSGSHFLAALDSMVTVHQDLRLHNGHNTGLLTQSGVAGQGVGVGVEAGLAGNAITDGDHGPPLGETSAQLAILSQPVAQAVQALGHFFAGKAGQVLGPGINFNPRNNPLARQDFGERGAIHCRLADSLIVHDYPTNELLHSLRGEQ